MKRIVALLLLVLSSGVASAQGALDKPAFNAALETLRASMLKLSSTHTLTSKEGKTYQYNLSMLEVTGDAATCTLSWKAHVDMKVSAQTRTLSINLKDVQRINALSSTGVLVLDPPVQIVQIHMSPFNQAIETLVHDNADGSPRGSPETTRAPTIHIDTSYEAEATAIVKQITALMTKCTPAL